MASGTSRVLSNPIILITFIAILIFAVIIDVADMFMEFIGASMVAPSHPLLESVVKSILSAIDFIATLIIGGWSFFVLKQSIPSKKGGKLQTKKSGEDTKTAKKGIEKGGKKATGKVAGKATGKVVGKVVRRVGLGLIGELIPFVGAAPFWTLTVIHTFISVIRGK